MMSDAARRTAEEILSIADIRVGAGDASDLRPWDIRVHEPKFFGRVLAEGSLGLGESYMDGWWDCEDLGGMTTRVFDARLEQQVKPNAKTLFAFLHSRLLNRQKKSRAVHSGGLPYRFGDDLFEAMLDPRMCYSCAYFGPDGADRDDLAQAQEQKLDLICRKIGLEAGDRVLDIGCGWGSFAGFAAEKYGANMLGVNVSNDQLQLGRKKTAHLEKVDLRFMDYRDLASSSEIERPFDHVVSIGMFEHVGVKNYRDFFQVAADCLADDGLFLLHTIGRNHSVRTLEPWIDKYVFPNCQLPSAAQISDAVEGIFVIEDWHNFGDHYATTLEHWWRNFDAAWTDLRGERYDDRFYRMWRFYLLGCVGRFRARRNQLWHLVLSKRGVKTGYNSVR